MEQQVQIYSARSPVDCAGSTKYGRFYVEQPLQQPVGGIGRVESQDCVVERGLICNTNGSGLIEGRQSCDPAPLKPSDLCHGTQ
jgi:hypothetical protein